MTNLSCVVGIGFVSLPKKTKGKGISKNQQSYVPGSKLLILEMVIPPLIGILIMGM